MRDGIDNLIAHSMTCTLEEEVGCARKYGRLRFGSPHEVIKEVHEGCLELGKRSIEQGK